MVTNKAKRDGYLKQPKNPRPKTQVRTGKPTSKETEATYYQYYISKMAILKKKAPKKARSSLSYGYLYRSKEWKEYSIEFRSVNNNCVNCGKDVHPDIYKETRDCNDIGVVDHKTPITMGKNRLETERLFRDMRNHQTLCTKCHNSKRGKEARNA